MIDIDHENLIPIRDVPCRLPPRKSGRRVHISAVYRWIKHGVRGGIRLEAVKIGGSAYTSKEALQRFIEQLSESMTSPAPSARAASSRQKQIDAATRRVTAIIEGRKPKKRSE